jgi:two-component system sensor histidine kinase AgrC
MKIRIGEMEEEFFCKNKVLNTILCEKKKEAIDNKINYQAYVEPGIPLDFIQDIDIIIIMGNIIDNAIEATKKLIMDTLILMYSQHKRDIS